MATTLLNECDKPGKQHYQILFMSWAGWVFDFYDLMLFTFLLMPIGKELHLSDIQLSFILAYTISFFIKFLLLTRCTWERTLSL